MSAEEIQGLLQ